MTGLALIEQLVIPAVKDAGYRLVRLRLKGADRKVLQVMAERPDGEMDVEDCANLSRAISDVLDAADPIETEFVLEVSSPGIDRPLTALEDYVRFSGHDVRLDLSPDWVGRKRFKGIIMGVDGNDVLLDTGDGKEKTRLRFPFDQIAESKLVLTDRLITESLKAQEARKKGAKAQN